MGTVSFDNLSPKKEGPQSEVTSNKVTPMKFKGKVSVQKESGWSKFAGSIIEEDKDTIVDHLIWDVGVPWVKDLIQNLVETTLDLALWGGNGRGRRTSYFSSRGDVPYNTYFKSNSSSRKLATSDREDRSIGYDNFLFESKDEAQEVLDRMHDLIDDYEECSLLDYYSILKEVIEDPAIKRKIKSNHTDDKYGWKDIPCQKPRLTRGGYILELPRAKYLD